MEKVIKVQGNSEERVKIRFEVIDRIKPREKYQLVESVIKCLGKVRVPETIFN